MGTKWAVKNNGVVQLNLFSSAPSGAEGQIYYNSTTKKLYYHNGTNWVESGALFTIYDDFEDGIVDPLKWTIDTSECYGPGVGSVTETNGSILVYAYQNSSDPSTVGSAKLTSVKDFKDVGKVEFDVMIGIQNGYDGGGYARILITDGGANTYTLKQFSTSTQGGYGTDGGGGVCVRLDCSGGMVTGRVVGAGCRSGNGYDIDAAVSKDVSTWANVYIRFYSYSKGTSGSNPMCAVRLKVSHVIQPYSNYL